MKYRSICDLNDAIVHGSSRLPQNINLVVGIPRSGLLAANLYALAANLPLADLDGFLAGRTLSNGKTREMRTDAAKGRRRTLILDDSINRGNAMRVARERIEAAGLADNCVFCAVYGAERHHPEADIVLERLPRPRLFEWNLFHHEILAHSCLDIDGVLCRDPTREENDDGPAYARFLSETQPLYVPSYPIGHLVTSRLEKFRDETERWLARNGIEYSQLHMLDLPSKAERRRLGAHASFKAGIYAKTETVLFIESEPDQAEQIARASGKPVLSLATHHLIDPEPLSVAAMQQRLRNVPLRLRLARSPLVNARSLKAATRSILGPNVYGSIKGGYSWVRSSSRTDVEGTHERP